MTSQECLSEKFINVLYVCNEHRLVLTAIVIIEILSSCVTDLVVVK